MVGFLLLVPTVVPWVATKIADAAISQFYPGSDTDSEVDAESFVLPPAVPIEVTCPNPGAGWIASFGWPGDLPDGAAAYSVRWQLDGGSIIRHDIGGWTDPARPPVDMRIWNDAEMVFFTDYLGDGGETLSSTEQTLELADSC